MVANTRTRVSPLSGPEHDTIGPFMRSLNIHKLKVVPDILQKTEVKVIHRPGAVLIDYRDHNEAQSATVTSINGGRILCEYCGSGARNIAWCHHIQYIVSKGVDNDLFNVPGTVGGEPDPRTIAVPIIPSEGVFVGVTLLDNEDHADFVDASVTFANSEGVDTEAHIGTLRRGWFGTQQLRSIVVDFLEGQMDNPENFTGKHEPYDKSLEASEFSQRFYLAVGGTRADWSASTGGAGDAPVF